jgi:hypothetical protein
VTAILKLLYKPLGVVIGVAGGVTELNGVKTDQAGAGLHPKWDCLFSVTCGVMSPV